MNVISKSASIESLGLSPGVHRLRVVVSEETVTYELETVDLPSVPSPRKGTGFIRRWSGTTRKVDIPGDERVAHINAKHLR